MRLFTHLIAIATLALACAFTPALAQPAPARAPVVANTPAAQRTVLVMGDSLSAGYGLAAQQGWVSLTAQKIAKDKPGWRVVNASISGETTAGGAARIEAELQRNAPSIVVIELGANDGLRGLPLAQANANLTKIILAAKKRGAKIVLVGMRLPPNYGPDYTRGFERMYADLAKTYTLAFVPFLLEPIALDINAFQADRMHPIASAQPKLRDHVWTTLAPLLK